MPTITDLSALMTTIVALLRPFKGRNQTEIATILTAFGVTGDKGHAASCPLRNYLAYGLGDTLPSDVNLVAGPFNIILEHGLYEEYVSVSHDTPENIHNFMAAFDDGQYPDLVRH